jgi:hypothetical protein
MDNNRFVTTLIQYLIPPLQTKMKEMLPQERGLRIRLALNSAISSDRPELILAAKKAEQARSTIGSLMEEVHTVDTFARMTAQVLNMMDCAERQSA